MLISPVGLVILYYNIRTIDRKVRIEYFTAFYEKVWYNKQNIGGRAAWKKETTRIAAESRISG
jgi:hypothetical protein